MEKLVQVSTLIANVLIIGLFALVLKSVDPFADTKKTTEEDSKPKTQQQIDIERESLISLWSSQGLTNVSTLVQEGNVVLEDKNTSVEQLKTIAEKTNKAANLVGYIQEEYADYYRENSRYDFVQKKVAPAHDAYVRLGNSLKEIRNKAYLELGKRIEETGDLGTAFFYYRDAYRLAEFDDNSKEGVRYRAEQEMKRLLGINDIESYVTW